MHVAVSKTDFNVQSYRELKNGNQRDLKMSRHCASDTQGICTNPFGTYKIITINDFQHVTVNRWRLAEVFALNRRDCKQVMTDAQSFWQSRPSQMSEQMHASPSAVPHTPQDQVTAFFCSSAAEDKYLKHSRLSKSVRDPGVREMILKWELGPNTSPTKTPTVPAAQFI